jgi:amidohydrolase
MLTNSDMAELIAFRRDLHRHPELSGSEVETAARVADFLAPSEPDLVARGLGGHGVAVVYAGDAPGPTLMVRAELDALPIHELGSHDHVSSSPGIGHLCGHDGHMTILAGLGRLLGRRRPARGRVVLLFQPAEETGKGAASVLEDADFTAFWPDMAISLHNMPGLPLGSVALSEGPANCASRGMRITLTGRTAHASLPETGISPSRAVAALLPGLTDLGPGGALDAGYRLVTVTHARMGEPAFGIAPGAAEIWATLRTLSDDAMAGLVAAAEALVRAEAEAAGLEWTVDYDDIFHMCVNAPEAVALLRRAIEAEGLVATFDQPPMKGSEDFGLFGRAAPSAMFLLGSGEGHPALHNPDFDFPEALIAPGVAVFHRAVREMLG